MMHSFIHSFTLTLQVVEGEVAELNFISFYLLMIICFKSNNLIQITFLTVLFTGGLNISDYIQ